jgi:hypothetical protein
MLASIGLVAVFTVASYWAKVRLAQIEAVLKKQMLERGMSAAEIEQVIQASREPGEDPRFTISGDIEADRASLVTLMSAYDYEGADIERVIREFANVPTGPSADDRCELIRARARAVHGMVKHQKEGEEIERVLRALVTSQSPGAP